MEKGKEECKECNGRGYTIWSCCGDDITEQFPENDLCPTCKEHCGEEKAMCSCADVLISS